MIDNVIVEMMSTEFLLWRCLHSGPLTRDSIDHWDPASELPFAKFRARNIPLLTRLTNTYGACAVVARDGERIVGQLRFYPKSLGRKCCAHGFCLQQEPPAGPSDELLRDEFPPLHEMADKTLVVNCIMTGSPSQAENPYQRRGIGARMVRKLIEWATAQGWEAIEATAYQDLPIVYAITGQTGPAFWQKLSFQVVEKSTEPELEKDSEFVRQMRQEAAQAGLDPDTIQHTYRMRLRLTPVQ